MAMWMCMRLALAATLLVFFNLQNSYVVSHLATCLRRHKPSCQTLPHSIGCMWAIALVLMCSVRIGRGGKALGLPRAWVALNTYKYCRLWRIANYQS